VVEDLRELREAEVEPHDAAIILFSGPGCQWRSVKGIQERANSVKLFSNVQISIYYLLSIIL
jgi:hypothetical protein